MHPVRSSFKRSSLRTAHAGITCALALAFACAIGGCDKKESPSSTPPTAATTAPAATTPTPPSSASAAATPKVAESGQMAHCPSAIKGAITAAKDVEGGIEVSITGSDEALGKEIRARMSALVESAKNDSATVKHSGHGEGGGMYGRCAVVMRNTALVASDVPNGSKVIVKPKSKDELDWLRRETRERIAELKQPESEGAGTGRMNNCPSAVDGAMTKVANTKDGVTVTVTAKGEPAVKDIRTRAKHIVDVVEKASGEARHAGGGQMGGGVGRCPVILKDTDVQSKDVEGGSAFTVKAKKAADVPELQKEAKERAANFMASASAAPAGSGAAAASASAAAPAGSAPKK